ncbi:hypothetical protein MTO96_033318 [Rhipicephalus appendiculatus]
MFLRAGWHTSLTSRGGPQTRITLYEEGGGRYSSMMVSVNGPAKYSTRASWPKTTRPLTDEARRRSRLRGSSARKNDEGDGLSRSFAKRSCFFRTQAPSGSRFLATTEHKSTTRSPQEFRRIHKLGPRERGASRGFLAAQQQQAHLEKLSADNARLVRHNVRSQANAPTVFNQAANDDDRQARLETLSVENTRLRSELDSMRAQMQGTATSDVRWVPTNASLKVHTPTEKDTRSLRGQQRCMPTDAKMTATRPLDIQRP